MKPSVLQITAALALAAAPSLVSSPTFRIVLLFPCLGAGMLLALRRNVPADTVSPSIREQLKAQDRNLGALAERLNDVMRQTEQAVLDINERFMSIAGHARTLLARNAEAARRPNAVPANATPACTAGSDLREQGSGSELQAMTEETAALTRDIHGVIEALQFEDIVRQQTEQIIGELQRTRKELAEMEQHLAPGDRPGPGAARRSPAVKGNEGVVQ